MSFKTLYISVKSQYFSACAPRWADESYFFFQSLWRQTTLLLCSFVFSQHNYESLHFQSIWVLKTRIFIVRKCSGNIFFALGVLHSVWECRTWLMSFRILCYTFKNKSLQEEKHYWFKTLLTSWWTVILTCKAFHCFTHLCFLLKQKCFKEFSFCK